jgi:hypothetical protein
LRFHRFKIFSPASSRTHADKPTRITAMANYNIARNNQQIIAACPEEEILVRLARGEILPTDLVWTAGMAEWKPASQVFGNVAGGPPPLNIPPAAPGPIRPYAPATAAVKPDSYLVWAILSTLLCCLPLGIVSIVYAAQVDSKWAAGDFAGAEASSANAKKFAIISAVSCVILMGVYFIGIGAFGAMSAR